MALSPQSTSEDALLASDEGILYNNALVEDERMGSASDNSSAEEELIGEQTLDYTQFERVLEGGWRRRSGGTRSGSGGQQSVLNTSTGTQQGSYRAVGQV